MIHKIGEIEPSLELGCQQLLDLSIFRELTRSARVHHGYLIAVPIKDIEPESIHLRKPIAWLWVLEGFLIPLRLEIGNDLPCRYATSFCLLSLCQSLLVLLFSVRQHCLRNGVLNFPGSQTGPPSVEYCTTLRVGEPCIPCRELSAG